jgi:flagellin
MPVVSTNLAANAACRLVNINAYNQSGSISKLASSSRIVKASDDAAGSAISTGIKADGVVLEQAARNVAQAITMLQVAEGGAASISNILMRMKALASQAASATVTDTERGYINREFTGLLWEIDEIGHSTRYNGISLLDGSNSFGAVMVGSDAADTLDVSFEPLDLSALHFGETRDWDNDPMTPDTFRLYIRTFHPFGWYYDRELTVEYVGEEDDYDWPDPFSEASSGAIRALKLMDHALDVVAAARTSYGAQMSRFEAHARTLATSIEGLSAANSSIEDLDVAAEQAKLSSIEVKLQSGVAALASANQMPKSLLKLFE